MPYLSAMKNALDDGELSVRIAAAIAINRLDPNDVDHQRVLIDAMKSGEGGIIVRVGQHPRPPAALHRPQCLHRFRIRDALGDVTDEAAGSRIGVSGKP